MLVTGCAGPRALDGTPPRAEDAATIIARYNANARRVERVWGTANAFIRFRDPDTDKMRREVGDGVFIFIRPDRVTLTTGKLGHEVLWAGTNDRQFWLFDLQDDGTAYVGSYARQGQPGAEPLPMPVHPDRLPSLLGLTPIDAREAYTEWHDGHLLVEPRWGARRLLLDARTGLPARVDLLDDEGRSVVICELTGVRRVRHADGAEEPAHLPAEAFVRVVGEAGDLTLKLANLTDAPDKFNDRLFDLDVLMRKHKPETVVNLDGE